MANYKPVKILFDIDDEYQRELYEHLMERTNKSSYIRSLLHQNLSKGGSQPPYQNNYEIVKEQENIKKVEETRYAPSASPAPKVSVKQPIEDDKLVLDGLF